MINTTKLVVITLILFTARISLAQEKQKEIGLQINDITRFHFDFIGKSENKKGNYRKLRLANLDIRAKSGQSSESSRASLNLAYGWEKRKQLNEKISLLHGWEPQLALVYGSSLGGVIVPGIGYALGVKYNLKNNFYLSLETIPSLSTQINVKQGIFELDNVQVNSSTSSVIASIVYSFTWK